MNQDKTALAQSKPIPLVWAGPILRRAENQRFIVWFATSKQLGFELELKYAEQELRLTQDMLIDFLQEIKIGKSLFIYCIDLALETRLPDKTWIGYDFIVIDQGQKKNWQDWAPELVYPHQSSPGFVIQPRISKLVHGSCRKPHSEAADGLVALDLYCQNAPIEEWPSVLMMSGDQVYVDDVAGPTLQAIHRLIPHLGIANEDLPGSTLTSSKELHADKSSYYQRHQLLPQVKSNENTLESFFGGIRKPIFTTVEGGNHLMSFAEIMAMYLLVWSPQPWAFISCVFDQELISEEFQERFQNEVKLIEQFVTGLSSVQRVMAHLPVAMIFDDHDVTDDWNLSIAWEKAAYGNPLSKRIIGNAMMAYLVCQGWGNAPEQFPDNFMSGLHHGIDSLGQQAHQHYIDELIRFRGWHYSWPTNPPLIVLDSRTNRWRSEKADHLPSGLMDWESITDLQQELCGHSAVVLVSPAPVFGVKLIEAIQHIFTFFGKPLMVDAENWMAHSGSAYALMNLFRHPKTPKYFTILSGDVHYSFVSQVELKEESGGPKIWQITSSGIKNEFPAKLLDFFDRFNRWLYAPYSPLNWFTKRKDMRIMPYKPDNASRGERLVNDSGLGIVEFNDKGAPVRITHLSANGNHTSFGELKGAARWGH